MARKKKIDKKVNEEEVVKVSVARKQEKQTKFAVLFMIILIVVLISSYFGVRFLIEKSSTFEYAGIKFTKDKLGYVASFPAKDVFGNVVTYYNFRFREDIRKLEGINMSQPILLKKNTFVDLETLFAQGNCDDGTVAGATVLTFLKKWNVNLLQGTTSSNISKLLNLTYISCSNISSPYSIVVLKNGNTSQITKQGNCYVLEAGNNCEILNVTEKFMVGFYANSMSKMI